MSTNDDMAIDEAQLLEGLRLHVFPAYRAYIFSGASLLVVTDALAEAGLTGLAEEIGWTAVRDAADNHPDEARKAYAEAVETLLSYLGDAGLLSEDGLSQLPVLDEDPEQLAEQEALQQQRTEKAHLLRDIRHLDALFADFLTGHVRSAELIDRLNDGANIWTAADADHLAEIVLIAEQVAPPAQARTIAMIMTVGWLSGQERLDREAARAVLAHSLSAAK